MSKEDTTKAIGKIITTDMGRDAIHVAVAPMEAAHQLFPGQHVGVVAEGKAGICETPVGIVDPFLRGPVQSGERFFLCLYPGTITSLRHEWVHPAFGDKGPVPPPAPTPDKAASEKWLREYAKRVKPYDFESEGEDAAYKSLLDGLKEGELFYHGRDLHDFSEVEAADELKHHAQIVLGITISWDHFRFSCSC